MKTLLLLRHAKSSWDDPSESDLNRPLADRGQRDAPRIGKALAKKGILPDLIISSTATRARQTIAAVVKSACLNAPLRFEERIYGAVAADLFGLILRLPDSSDCVLLVGHNPGFEDITSRLTGVGRHMPTAALACVELQIDRWADIQEGQGRLLWFLSPKQPD